jgi:hypothetical protein
MAFAFTSVFWTRLYSAVKNRNTLDDASADTDSTDDFKRVK